MVCERDVFWNYDFKLIQKPNKTVKKSYFDLLLIHNSFAIKTNQAIFFVLYERPKNHWLNFEMHVIDILYIKLI